MWVRGFKMYQFSAGKELQVARRRGKPYLSLVVWLPNWQARRAASGTCNQELSWHRSEVLLKWPLSQKL